MDIVNSIDANLEMMDEAKSLLEERDCPGAEAVINEVIKNVEASEYYKEDVKEGRRCFYSDDEKSIYEKYTSASWEEVRFPYAEMYKIKADALINNEECISLMEEAHKWAPANHEIALSLADTYFKFDLFDKALECTIKAFRFVNEKQQESKLFYYIRRIGEGCWELHEEELESAEQSIKAMKAERYADDFAPYGIPTSADKMRILSDEEVRKIVKTCYPAELSARDIKPEARIREHKDKCPLCGDNRYFVVRVNTYAIDAYGEWTTDKENGPLVAFCLRCRDNLYVPWVEKKNRDESEARRKQYDDDLVNRGYKKADIQDVIEKYGFMTYEDLSDIISFSGLPLSYDDDYEIGLACLIQDMYDVPAIVCFCIDSVINEYSDFLDQNKLSQYYDTAMELSKQVCENLVYMYDAEIIYFSGTKDEPPQLIINGELTDEDSSDNEPISVHHAIQRALDKMKEA